MYNPYVGGRVYPAEEPTYPSAPPGKFLGEESKDPAGLGSGEPLSGGKGYEVGVTTGEAGHTLGDGRGVQSAFGIGRTCTLTFFEFGFPDELDTPGMEAAKTAENGCTGMQLVSGEILMGILPPEDNNGVV